MMLNTYFPEILSVSLESFAAHVFPRAFFFQVGATPAAQASFRVEVCAINTPNHVYASASVLSSILAVQRKA
jgi:hypothetical protein